MKTHIVGDFVDQIMDGCSYGGWCKTAVSQEFQDTATQVMTTLLKRLQPQGPGGVDFLSVQGQPYLTDINFARFNGCHPPKLFHELYAPDSVFYAGSLDVAKGESLPKVDTFFAALKDQGMALECSVASSGEGRNKTGVFPLIYCDKTRATCIAFAETPEAAAALWARTVRVWEEVLVAHRAEALKAAEQVQVSFGAKMQSRSETLVSRLKEQEDEASEVEQKDAEIAEKEIQEENAEVQEENALVVAMAAKLESMHKTREDDKAVLARLLEEAAAGLRTASVTGETPVEPVFCHRRSHEDVACFSGGTQDCAVCLQLMSSASIALRCGHRFCGKCLEKCSTAELDRCPICRHPHELDPNVLKERFAGFRKGYRSWRKGGAKGAKGELDDVSAATQRSPAAQRDLVVTAVGKASDPDTGPKWAHTATTALPAKATPTVGYTYADGSASMILFDL